MKPCSQSQIGMTLIEVMIVVFILGLIAAGISALVQQMGRVTNNMQAQSGRTSLESVLHGVLSDEAVCTSRLAAGINFVPPTAGSTGVTDMVFNLGDGTPQTVVSENQNLRKYDVAVLNNGFQLIVPAGATGTVFGTETHWLGFLELATQKLKQSAGGQAMRRSAIGAMTVRVNAGGQIVGCYGTPNFACPAGMVQVGPDPATDCMTVAEMIGSLCPAGNVPVSDGSGGVVCSPYTGPTGGPTPGPTGWPTMTPTPTPTGSPSYSPGDSCMPMSGLPVIYWPPPPNPMCSTCEPGTVVEIPSGSGNLVCQMGPPYGCPGGPYCP